MNAIAPTSSGSHVRAREGVPMRISVRSDLGGYAVGLPGIRAVEGVEITKPFVLFVGANGSGKTALIRMMRAAMGLDGDRTGHAGDTVADDRTRLPTLEECENDLGRMAACVSGRVSGIRMDQRDPGVLDVAELGWRGERSWLYSSRSETVLRASPTFDRDIGYHAGMLADTGPRASHGQVLRGAWGHTLRWAHASLTHDDPYDRPEDLAPVRRALWDAVRARDGDPAAPRPRERWVFLDEPEVALDMHSLLWGLSALVHNAAPGRLRVFCASHSPLFAAGLADHPNVQVVDLGAEVAGENNGFDTAEWFRLQRNALRLAADRGATDGFALEVALRCQAQGEHERQERERAARARMAAALRGMTPFMKGLLMGALDAGEGEVALAVDGKRVPWRTVFSLRDRGIVRTEGMGRSERAWLTPFGGEVARHLAGSGPQGA